MTEYYVSKSSRPFGNFIKAGPYHRCFPKNFPKSSEQLFPAMFRAPVDG